MAKFKFKSSKAKRKINFIETKSSLINSQMITGAHFEIFSNREIVLEGCRKILDYTNEYIKLQLEKGTVIICGQKLQIVNFEAENILIKGLISNIEFCV